jgi:LCP family protein required for cell wall assembly
MSELRPRSTRSIKTAGIARHGRLRKAGPWGAILAFVAASLAVVLVSGTAVAGIVVANTVNQTKTVTLLNETEGPPPSIGAYPNGFNMLIVGSDMCEEDDGCDGRGSANLNDVTMLLHVSADGTNATAVSFPRDLVVPIPSCPKADGSGNNAAMAGRPINETLYYGGLPCTVLTVENLTGLDIQFAGLITFNGVIRMTNAVGGVDVCIAGDLNDSRIGLHLTKGTHKLQGTKALKFLRSRHGVGDGSDLTRISSQQVYLSSLVRTLKSKETLTDPIKVYKLAQAATTSMTLSNSLKQLDVMASIAYRLKDIPLEDITFVQYPGTTGVTSPAMYVGKVAPIQAQADALFAKLRADEPFKLASVGDGRGSEVNPNAPEETETESTSTAAPVDKSTLNVKGQTAADYTCTITN